VTFSVVDALGGGAGRMRTLSDGREAGSGTWYNSTMSRGTDISMPQNKSKVSRPNTGYTAAVTSTINSAPYSLRGSQTTYGRSKLPHSSN
jgi:hypothetical protein